MLSDADKHKRKQKPSEPRRTVVKEPKQRIPPAPKAQPKKNGKSSNTKASAPITVDPVDTEGLATIALNPPAPHSQSVDMDEDVDLGFNFDEDVPVDDNFMNFMPTEDNEMTATATGAKAGVRKAQKDKRARDSVDAAGGQVRPSKASVVVPPSHLRPQVHAPVQAEPRALTKDELMAQEREQERKRLEGITTTVVVDNYDVHDL